jgi:hypothetical protein
VGVGIVARIGSDFDVLLVVYLATTPEMEKRKGAAKIN